MMKTLVMIGLFCVAVVQSQYGKDRKGGECTGPCERDEDVYRCGDCAECSPSGEDMYGNECSGFSNKNKKIRKQLKNEGVNNECTLRYPVKLDSEKYDNEYLVSKAGYCVTSDNYNAKCSPPPVAGEYGKDYRGKNCEGPCNKSGGKDQNGKKDRYTCYVSKPDLGDLRDVKDETCSPEGKDALGNDCSECKKRPKDATDMYNECMEECEVSAIGVAPLCDFNECMTKKKEEADDKKFGYCRHRLVKCSPEE